MSYDDTGRTHSRRDRPMTHELKTWPVFFQKVWDGVKTAELRRDDRDWQPGDGLVLREYDPMSASYSGRRIEASITDIVRDADEFGLRDGFVMLSMAVERLGVPAD